MNEENLERLENIVRKTRIGEKVNENHFQVNDLEILALVQCIREVKELSRQRALADWRTSYDRQYKGRRLLVTERSPGKWFYEIDPAAMHESLGHDLIAAAQEAAMAWVDEQEGTHV